MIVACPHCKVRLRYQDKKTGASLFVIRCPKCLAKFKTRNVDQTLKALIAHEDEAVRSLLTERLSFLGIDVRICCSTEDISNLLTDGHCVLLLDVAFNGTFPFQLLERINAAGNDSQKVILLPSVYNRTAYKKRPESLYGADAYLELHHIGDQLLPLLAELYPTLKTKVNSVAPIRTASGERKLVSAPVSQQADALAKLLVADILFYHQERMAQGLESGQMAKLFAEPLAEGRRVLISRIPQAESLAGDFIQQAFDDACQTYPIR